MTWIESFKDRNALLFYFGVANLLLALLFVVLSRTSSVQIVGVNAWHKPIKFALSIGIFSLTMAWYTAYLGQSLAIRWYSWAVVITLGFEIVYIAIQAARGQQSHFNLSTPFYSFLYQMMALAATVATLWTAYIGILFFQQSFPELPSAYVWGIRLGILLFVIFSLEGFVMGARLSHTIGGPDGEAGLPFLNWSRKYGDPRIAHFIGMHALQVLPILAYYLLKDVKLTFLAAAFYALLAFYVLWQAFQGKPFLRF